MTSSPPEPREEAALARLRMLRVAKDLFLSEWYREGCRELRFSGRACGLLARIEEETAQEREDVLDAISEWARRLDAERGLEGPAHVAHAVRRDFLLQLIDAKEASGEVLERAALVAPPALREEFQRLAAIDFRHSVALRELLVEEVQDEWRSIVGRAEARRRE